VLARYALQCLERRLRNSGLQQRVEVRLLPKALQGKPLLVVLLHATIPWLRLRRRSSGLERRSICRPTAHRTTAVVLEVVRPAGGAAVHGAALRAGIAHAGTRHLETARHADFPTCRSFPPNRASPWRRGLARSRILGVERTSSRSGSRPRRRRLRPQRRSNLGDAMGKVIGRRGRLRLDPAATAIAIASRGHSTQAKAFLRAAVLLGLLRGRLTSLQTARLGALNPSRRPGAAKAAATTLAHRRRRRRPRSPRPWARRLANPHTAE